MPKYAHKSFSEYINKCGLLECFLIIASIFWEIPTFSLMIA